MFNHILLIWF